MFNANYSSHITYVLSPSLASLSQKSPSVYHHEYNVMEASMTQIYTIIMIIYLPSLFT